MLFFDTMVGFWSHRLTVRTPGFHPGNRSSILREITIENASSFDGAFSMDGFHRKSNFDGVRYCPVTCDDGAIYAIFSVRSPKQTAPLIAMGAENKFEDCTTSTKCDYHSPYNPSR